MTPKPQLLLLSVFILSTAAGPGITQAEKEDRWPCFHGTQYDNISAASGLLEEWPEGGPKLLWTFDGCGGGYSMVSVADGMIFTAGDFGLDEMVIALDMNGTPVWKAKNGKSWRGSTPGSRTTPTWNDGMLYHLGPHGTLSAFEASSGTTVWTVELADRFGARFGMWGLSENLAVEGDLVLCMPGGKDGFVVALDKKTGETVWKSTSIDRMAAYCSPLVVTWKGVRQYISLTGKEVVSIDVKTGKKRWSHPHPTRYNQAITTPIFSKGYVFITSGHSGGGRLIQIGPDQKQTREIWYRVELDSCHGGVILVDGRLFGSSCRLGGKMFFCVDFKTGKTIQADRTLGKISLTCAGGRIYALNDAGTMRLIDITPDGFSVVSTFRLPRRSRDKYLCHPVVCGGRLYIRHGGHLYTYAVGKD